MAISRSLLLRMSDVSDKSYTENQETFYVPWLFPENRAFYEIRPKNIVQPDRPQVLVWRMRIACWITKATNTRSEYVILIAFPRQKWLSERSSNLRLHVHYVYCYCIILMTFLCGSKLLELYKTCDSHIFACEGYWLPQCNDIECSRDILTFGGVYNRQSWGCLFWIWGRQIKSKRRRLLLLQEEMWCVRLILFFLGGGVFLYFIFKLYLCLFVCDVHKVHICYCPSHSWSVGRSRVVKFFLTSNSSLMSLWDWKWQY